MASQGPTPTKRPPRPEAKKPPPPAAAKAGGGSGRPGSRSGSAAGAGRRPPPRRKRGPDKKTIGAIVGVALVFALVVFFAFAVVGSNSTIQSVTASSTGPEGVAVPAGTALGAINTANYGQPVDGIECQAGEQVVYHVHTHLDIFVDGKAKQVPFGIGIGPPRKTVDNGTGPFVQGGTCFYWLHTHASDGIIHVESPSEQQYNLGQFFDLWGQVLTPDQVGPAVGKVTAYLNGQLYPGNPRTITLGKQTTIQLDVGKVVAPQTITFPQSL